VVINELTSSIESFFTYANPSDYQKVTNELLATFIEKSGDNRFSSEELGYVTHIILLQNNFIAKIKENWDNYNRISNLKPQDYGRG